MCQHSACICCAVGAGNTVKHDAMHMFRCARQQKQQQQQDSSISVGHSIHATNGSSSRAVVGVSVVSSAQHTRASQILQQNSRLGVWSPEGSTTQLAVRAKCWLGSATEAFCMLQHAPSAHSGTAQLAQVQLPGLVERCAHVSDGVGQVRSDCMHAYAEELAWLWLAVAFSWSACCHHATHELSSGQCAVVCMVCQFRSREQTLLDACRYCTVQ